MIGPIRRSGLFVVAALLAVTTASTADAGGRGRQGVGFHHHAHRARGAKWRPAGFIRMPGARSRHGMGEVPMGAPNVTKQRLSVERSWGSRGVGSLGYQRLAASPLDVHEVNAAAGTQFGAPAAVVGGGVSYRF